MKRIMDASMKKSIVKRGCIFFALAYLVVLILYPSQVKIQFHTGGQVSGIEGYSDENRVIPEDVMLEDMLVYGYDMTGTCWRYDFSDTLLKFQDFSLRVKLFPAENGWVDISDFKIAIGNFTVFDSGIDNIETIVDTSGGTIFQEDGILYWNTNDYGNEYIEVNFIDSILKQMYIYKVVYLFIALVFICFVVLWGIKKFEQCISICRSIQERVERITCWQVVKNIGFFLFFVMLGVLAVKTLEILGVHGRIQNNEIMLISIGEFFIFTLLKKRTESLKLASVGCIVCLVGMFIAIEGMTTFLTVDENRAIDVIYYFPEGSLRHWLMEESRISYCLMGTLWRIIPNSLEGTASIEVLQTAKLLHWLLGFLVIILIVDVAQNKILNQENTLTSYKVLFNYVILLNGILLFPVLDLGMKNYNNYDLFSMLFGVLAFEYLFLGIKNKNLKYGWLGYVIAVLALLEKLNALPLYIVAGASLILIAYIKYLDKGDDLKGVGKFLSKMLIVPFGTSVFTQIYVINILGGNHTQIYPIKHAFIILMAMPLRLTWKIGQILGIDRISSGRGGWALLFSTGLMGIGICLCGVIFCFFYRIVQRKANNIIIRRISVIILVLYFGMGIILTFCNTKNVTSVVKYFVNSFPIISLILLTYIVVTYKKNWKNLLLFIALSFGIIGITVIYALIGEWPGARYMNIYCLVVELCFLILALQRMNDTVISIKMHVVIAVGMITGLVLDIMPSMPAFSFYIPVYSNSVLDTDETEWSWFYWGEQISLAGEEIEDYCIRNDIQLQNVRLYTGYHGTWLTNEYQMSIMGNEWITDAGNRGISDTDFYLFDKTAICTGMFPYGIPDVEPIITIKYRNNIVARVYQGSQLINYFAQMQ